jgi:hypothetical protein
MNIAIGNTNARTWRAVSRHAFLFLGFAVLGVVVVTGLARLDRESSAETGTTEFTPPAGIEVQQKANLHQYYLVSADAQAAAIRAEEKAPNVLRRILVFGSPEYEAQYRDMESLLELGVIDVEIIDLTTSTAASDYAGVSEDWTLTGVWDYHFHIVDSEEEAARVLSIPEERNIARVVLVNGSPRFEEGLRQIDWMLESGLSVSVFDLTKD